MLNKKLFWDFFLAITELVGQKPSKTLAKMYYETIKHLTDDEFSRAAQQILATHRYNTIPKPAEILELVHGNAEDRARLAAETLLRAIETYGAYNTVVFEDPIINTIIAKTHGGWPEWCQITYDEWKYREKDFIKLYKAYLRNPGMVKPVKRLPGVTEHANGSLHGFDVPDVPVQRIPAPYVPESEKKKYKALIAGVEEEPINEIKSIGKNIKKLGDGNVGF